MLLFLECYCFLLGFVIVFECGGSWDDRFFIQHLSVRFKCQRVHVCCISLIFLVIVEANVHCFVNYGCRLAIDDTDTVDGIFKMGS